MLIEIWSDYMCPFCYIAKKRLKTALKHFDLRSDVKIKNRSFELMPEFTPEAVYVYDMLAERHGKSLEEIKPMTESMVQLAKTAGLNYRFDGMIATNSFNAHRLTHFSAKHGKQDELNERLFKACYTEARHLGDYVTLVELAADVGLDKDEAARVLNSDEYSINVRNDEKEAQRLGIRGVPYFLINGTSAISGLQSVDEFTDLLRKTWNEKNQI